MERRSGQVNDWRRARLAAITAAGESSIEQVVDVLLVPYLELVGEEGDVWKSYARLNAQLARSLRWSGLIKNNFYEVVSLLIDELERILTECPAPASCARSSSQSARCCPCWRRPAA